MKRTIRFLLLMSALSGCWQMTVHSEYDHAVNFSSLRTYDWRAGPQLDTGDPRFDTSWADTSIRTDVDDALTAKGYKKAAAVPPDFLVGTQVVLQDKTFERYSLGDSPGTYYTQGTLLIEMLDPKTMKVLWRGSAAGVADPSASRETRESHINEAVEKILKKFPPS